MIKNYIILAHKAPEQLQRMITQLDDEDAMFFIHLDAKADLTAFEQVVKGPRVQFITQREHCLPCEGNPSLLTRCRSLCSG
ncbi:hypothetical protein SAMN05444369_10660 [Capnocytophaga haemolytica]|uniref:Glycosyl transferase n=1 Tax=Capnocytophaga haemolytica TaxID=45243 RepID=A0AAX2GYZ3_9FLAO|nr:hypothetical protein [Capnocytophaga haemolytica]AMD84562.1 hypothetical protein AXF12_02910 [Capnocytophaga haemolytica]SFN99341.1 hypothetical protein SAMN05444369_10660 [Capnocytophaga haemolytica]SNV09293.1 Uncharacterised protein [Capnocytophaga haemolytica]